MYNTVNLSDQSQNEFANSIDGFIASIYFPIDPGPSKGFKPCLFKCPPKATTLAWANVFKGV